MRYQIDDIKMTMTMTMMELGIHNNQIAISSYDGPVLYVWEGEAEIFVWGKKSCIFKKKSKPTR